MPPLALKLARQLTLPVNERRPFLGPSPLSSLLDDIHCFEMSSVLPLLETVLQMTGEDMSSSVFLPAPRTWIEYKPVSNPRMAFLLTDQPNEGVARVDVVVEGESDEIGVISTREGRKAGFDPDARLSGPDAQDPRMIPALLLQVQAFLVMINSPKVIGRKQIMPHRGLEKKLRQRSQAVGKFPLHAWSELKLEVRDQPSESSKEHEAHYTGEKCLHFCRAHLRVRNGQLERVRSHWRGDPALGIKRTRYTVVPQKEQRNAEPA